VGIHDVRMTQLPQFIREPSRPRSEGIHAVQATDGASIFRGATGLTRGPYVVHEDCPPGLRWTLVTECLSWLPEYECVWKSAGEWDCWVKKWHCTWSQQVWRCQPPTFRVIG
jgi:hypothetical protein